MYSPTAKARLQAPAASPRRDRRVSSLRQRRAAELEALQTEVAVCALAAYYTRQPPPDRRPLWLRSLEAGKQLKGAR